MKETQLIITLIIAIPFYFNTYSAQSNDTTMPAAELPKEPQFFIWLKSLGVESNRVEQLKQEIDFDQLRKWIDEANPPAQNHGKLFNGKNLTGFYCWLEKFGTQNDPDAVFSVTPDNLIMISGQHRGFLSTMQSFTNYHLVAEYKWGAKMWGKASEKPRNSGIVINAVGDNKIWSKGIEIQIADGQTGDIVVLDGARLTSSDGVTHSKPWSTFYRDDPKERQPIPGWRAKNDPENPPGEWNKIDIINNNGKLIVLVNNKKVFNGANCHPSAGKIYLQSNGSEIFFKNLEIKPVAE